MSELEYERFIAVLEQLTPKKQLVFLAALQLFLECSKDGSDTSALLLVRHPVEDAPESEWLLHISALNADRDDAYEMLDLAVNKMAADIQQEAPDRDSYN
jgi:hypothetical protein